MTESQKSRNELEEMLIRLLQKEYSLCGEIEDLTKELAEAMDRDDQVSIGMVLKMRGQTMAEVDKAVRERRLVLNAAGEGKERLQKLTTGQEVPDMTETEKRILRLFESRRLILERAAGLDRKISKRLAGEKSFYSK